ncbi:MAG: dihydroorotase [Armatimonadetes bacterium]|nr:dihydroorotase [Armatimonadota bacterium]
MKTLIRGGRVIDPANGIDDVLDVLLESGEVAALAKSIGAPDAEVIDASGQVVAPGFVDLHVHLRTPGQEHKETIATGTRAAVAGGFTTICCMPNTDPPIHDRSVAELVLSQARAAGFAKVIPLAAVSPSLKHETLTEMADLKAAGCAAVSDDGKAIQSSSFLRRILEYASMLDLPVVLHCEDYGLSEGGAMNEGYQSTVLGLKGMPREAEEVGIMRAILLAKCTGAHVHFCHVSTAYGVEMIRRAKAEGVRVTAEATPHHFSLTDEDVGRQNYDTNTKMVPPLRTADDVAALVEGLKDGTIDGIATDHAPHATEDKEVEYDQAAFGIVGLETALGVTLKYLVEPGHVSLSDAVAMLTCRPAAALKLSAGTLTPESAADVVVFNPTQKWTVDPGKFHSRGRNTPYARCKLLGVVSHTLVDGRTVHTHPAT